MVQLKKAIVTIGFILIVFASQAIWVTYSPVITYVSKLLNAPVSFVGFLAVTYPIFFLILTIPSGILLDKNFRFWLMFGVVFTALAGIGRLFDVSSFFWIFVCQIFGALGQPFLLNAFVPYASRLYAERQTMIVSVLSLFMYLGTIFALVSGYFLFRIGGLAMLALPAAVIAAIGFILILPFFRELPVEVESENVFTMLGKVARRKDLWIIGAILGLGVAAFDNLATWLQPALSTVGLGKVAGEVVAVSIGFGLLGMIFIPDIVAKKNIRSVYLKVATPVLAAFFTILSIFTHKLLLFAFLAVGGLLMLPAYPIIMDWIGKFHEKEIHGSATGFVGLVSRALSVTLTVTAVYFIWSARVYFTFLAILIIVAFGFALVLPRDTKS